MSTHQCRPDHSTRAKTWRCPECKRLWYRSRNPWATSSFMHDLRRPYGSWWERITIPAQEAEKPQ